MLTERDPDFCDYFKVEADFGVLMDRTFENEVEYAKLIGSLSKKKKIPFTQQTGRRQSY